ncbi:hypothetical protein ACFS4T_11810 [Pseudomonas lini]
MNESERAEILAREAVAAYEAIPVAERSVHGRRLLGMAVMQLGRILNDEAMLRNAIDLLVAEVDEKNYKSDAIADIWLQVGECYHILRELYMAEKNFIIGRSQLSLRLWRMYSWRTCRLRWDAQNGQKKYWMRSFLRQ